MSRVMRKHGTVVKEFRVPCEGGEFFKVPVRFDRRNNTFLVDIDTPCPVSLSHKDVDALEKETRLKIQEHFSTKWDSVLQINVDTGDQDKFNHSYSQRALSISYKPYEITTRLDGKKAHRHPNARHSQDDWPFEGKDESYDHHRMYAVIPDTPENRKALESILEAVDKLSERVMELMSPEKIVQTLEASPAFLALPVPESQKPVRWPKSPDIKV